MNCLARKEGKADEAGWERSGSRLRAMGVFLLLVSGNLHALSANSSLYMLSADKLPERNAGRKLQFTAPALAFFSLCSHVSIQQLHMEPFAVGLPAIVKLHDEKTAVALHRQLVGPSFA